MPKKKTQEEYERDVKEKAPHVQVIGKYINSRTPIKHYCLKHNVDWNVSPFNFLLSYSTVYSWLKRMSKEGLCSYNPVIGRSKKHN